MSKQKGLNIQAGIQQTQGGDSMASNEFTVDKQHVLIFKTNAGDMIVGTNALREVAQQDWFREFLNLGGSVRQVAVSQPQANPPQSDVSALVEEVRQLRERQNALSQQVPRQSQSSPVMPPRPRVAQSFLDIDPNQMNDQIWGGLNPQQQREWQMRYFPQ
jgi:hypothetical protein